MSEQDSDTGRPYDGPRATEPKEKPKTEPAKSGGQNLSSIQDRKLKREQKAVYTLLNIVILFLICWIPFYSLFVVRFVFNICILRLHCNLFF